MPMFSPLGALGAFGSTFGEGIEQGMTLKDRYDMGKGAALLQRAIGGVESMSPMMSPVPMAQAPPAPSPGAPSQPPQAMPGASPPMQASMQPGPVPMPRGPQPQMAPDPRRADIQAPPGRMTSPQPMAGPPPGADDAAMQTQGAVRALQSGQPLNMQQLARLIERANPDASPTQKFYAMRAGMQMLNQGDQTAFNRMMQVAGFQQRERFHADTEQRAEERAARAERTQERADIRVRQQSPYVQSEKATRTQTAKNLETAETRSLTMVKHFDKLSELAEKVSLTGSPKLDEWLNNVAATFGNETAILYKNQLNNVRSELATLLGSSPSGVVPVSLRNEVSEFALSGVMRPHLIEGLKQLYAWDAKTKKEIYSKQIKQHDKNIAHYMKTGELPEEVPEEAPASTGTGGGTTPIPQGVTITPVR